MSFPFKLDSLPSPTTPWGPSTDIPSFLNFNHVPYAPFSKNDKLGKAADWQSSDPSNNNFNNQQNQNNSNKNKNQRDYFHAYGASAAQSFAAERFDDDGDFNVVDNKASTRSTTVLRGRNPNQQGQNQGGQGHGQGQGQNQGPNTQRRNTQQQGANQNKGNQGRPPYQRRNWKDNKENARTRDASIEIQDSWKVIADIEFNRLTKLNLEVNESSEIDSYGSIKYYNKAVEKSTNNILKISDRVIYNPTASEDPIIQELSSAKKAQIFTTDSVLTQLMCASRSLYSWDIVVTKKNGQIFLDKREGSILDRLTVDENSNDPPSDANDQDINNANKLSLEATYINENFITQSISEQKTYKFKHPENPFHDESLNSEPVLSKGYKYKKFTLPATKEDNEDMDLIVRTEVDSINIDQSLILIKAVNESISSSLDWKTNLNQKMGAIIAAELKKNNNKISKWTLQAILSGVDQLKLGFVSRITSIDNSKHVILGMASYKPSELALQMNLAIGNGWGIVRSLIDLIETASGGEDGTFIILKDPNFSKLTIFNTTSE